MKQSFIFGGNTNLSYDQIQKQRDIANELLRANMSTPQNVGEGLSAIGRALAAKAIDKRTTRADEANRKAYEARRDDLFGMLGGGAAGGGSAGYSPSGTWTPAPPPPKPTDSFMGKPDAVFDGGNSFNMPSPAGSTPSAPLSFGAAVMTPQEMLIEGAKARGLDPIDVATAISYETGGKFDPMISGPTTQWGTHKGLIQFGEPQAQQHGADFANADAAWRSQLNPTNGAVWSYLDSTGVKPGMGLDQIYSAINAGGVNRFGASDANNGGAPGTVADKVAGMGPHREKAAQFLGGTWTPADGGQPTVAPAGGVGGGMANPAILMALAETAGNPYASDSDKAIANLLMGQITQSMDPMRQLQIEKTQLELDQMRNPQPGFTMLTDEQEAQMGLNPTGVYQQGPDGAIKVVQDAPKADGPTSTMQEYEFARSQGYEGTFQQYQADLKKAGATNVTVDNGSEVGTIPQGYELFTDENGARSMRPIAGGPEDPTKANEKAAGGRDIATQTVTSAAQRAREAANSRMVSGALSGIAAMNPASDNAEIYRQVEVLKSQAIVGNLQAMRDASPTGGALGAVTAPELKMLADKSGALDPRSDNFIRDLNDYELSLLQTIHGPEEGKRIFEATRTDAPTGPDQDGWQTINGVKIRVKQ